MNSIEQTRTQASYGAGIGMLIAFAIGGFILSMIVSLQVWAKVSGMDYETVMAAVTNPKYVQEMQLIQSISMIFGFLAPAVFTASRLNSRPFALLGLTESITAKQIILAVLIFSCAMAIGSSLGYLSYQLPLPTAIKAKFDSMEAEYMKQAMGLISMDSPFKLFTSLIVIALVPAICEEFFFRGALQNFIYRSSKNMWLAVLLASIIFSLVHFSGYGFLTRVLLGLVLGLIYHYSGSLWLSILAHFINNAFALLAFYFSHAAGKSLTEAFGDRSGSYWGFIAIPLLIYLLLLLKKESPKNLTANNGV